MMKSILAVSEGGPDAAMSFRLAARVAGDFDGSRGRACTCRSVRPAAWSAAWP